MLIWTLCRGGDRNINLLELIPVFLAVRRLGALNPNSHLFVESDNTQVVNMLNNGVSKNRTCMMMLRTLFWLLVHYNCTLFCVHIPGILNIVPDFLSRIFKTN